MYRPRFFPLNAAQHGGDVAPATRRVPWVKALAVVPVRDVDAFVSRDRMRIDDGCGMDAVLPLFLHFGVHHQ